MLPQFYRQTAPQYRPQQYAGLGARANAGIGGAVAGLGQGVAGWAEEKTDRGDAIAASGVFRQLDDYRIAHLRELPQRRAELAAAPLDPMTGKNLLGFEKEIDAFPNLLKAKFEELSENLSSGARAKLELAYNAAAPGWSAEFVTTLDKMELAGVRAEARDLAQAGRAADALELLGLYRDRLGPEKHQVLAGEVLLSGAMADVQAIAGTDGWDAAARAAEDPVWQHGWGLDLPEAAGVRDALAGFVSQARARGQAELEAQREAARDALADLRAAALPPTPEEAYALIDQSGLSEDEQVQQMSWFRAEADRRIAGPPVVTDEAVRHRLKADALDIGRGRMGYRDLVTRATEAKARGDLDNEAYKDVLSAARAELSGAQAEALRSVSRSAERQLVTVSESAIERYAALMADGRPGAKDTLARAETQRQIEYRLLDFHDAQVLDFVSKNPEATGDELHRLSRKILLTLRRANASERSKILADLDAADVDGRPAGPPAGLEEIWEGLSAEEQESVLLLLRRGFTIEDILNHLRAQSGAN